MALVTIAVVVSILNVAALALGATPAGAQTLGTVDVAATATGYLTVDTGGNVTAVNTAHLGNASVGQAAALAATRSGDGYWIAGADGSIKNNSGKRPIDYASDTETRALLRS